MKAQRGPHSWPVRQGNGALAGRGIYPTDHATNRGKRSIELDFESEDGRRIVTKLAARSDVLIENFKVGGLAKFGLDYASLSKDNPRLIYCSVTGFGQTGPYASRAGYDLMAQGMGGIMD